MTFFPLSRVLPLALALSSAGLVTGCGALDYFSPHSESAPAAAAAANPGGDTPQSEKVVRLPLSSEELDCPPVEIDEGGAAARVGGPENSQVRYQFTISQTARQCDPVSTNQFTLKVGVSGRLLIGPAGKPGAYSAPLRVTVHDENAKKDVFSKVYKIEASVPDAGDAPFNLVTEPIALPMTGTDLADDYTLTVGFDNGKAAAESPRPKKPHPKLKKTAAPN